MGSIAERSKSSDLDCGRGPGFKSRQGKKFFLLSFDMVNKMYTILFVFIGVLMARPVAIRDGPRAKGPRASSNHYSLVSPHPDGIVI